MIDPPRWTFEELEANRIAAMALFCKQRIGEPLEAYLGYFDDYHDTIENLLEVAVDLTDLEERALDILADQKLLEAFRYLSGPPISRDDLKTLAEAELSPARLKNDPDMVRRVVGVILAQLDRRRFLWVGEHREPTETERAAAVLATAALMATSRLSTTRRNDQKEAQERNVEEMLLGEELTKVKPRGVTTLNQAPEPGEFCREARLGARKADFIIGLWDHRVMALECKVSNSATNSVKRLNNDAAAKAEAWRRDFGLKQVVPAAILGGVYKLHNLEDAQERGLTLFWAHDLSSLTRWIRQTKPD